MKAMAERGIWRREVYRTLHSPSGDRYPWPGCWDPTAPGIVNMMKVLRQLLREFRFPIGLAIAWTAYNIWTSGWSLAPAIKDFGASLFFLAYFSGQWFRVQKQQRVDEGLGGIEAKAQRMLSDLDAKTTNLIGHITGGESSPCLVGKPGPDDRLGTVAIEVLGEHSLRDVQMRIVNLANFGADNLGKTIAVGDVLHGHARVLAGDALFDCRHSDDCRFNIFFTAFNGSTAQLLRLRKVDGQWRVATRVLAHGKVAYEYIDTGFPEQPDWDGETRAAGVTLARYEPKPLS
jgi:hypothetical protein